MREEAGGGGTEVVDGLTDGLQPVGGGGRAGLQRTR
jgi:hypothetical protein